MKSAHQSFEKKSTLDHSRRPEGRESADTGIAEDSGCLSVVPSLLGSPRRPPLGHPRVPSHSPSRAGRLLLSSIGRPFDPPSDALQSLTICLLPPLQAFKAAFFSKRGHKTDLALSNPPAHRRIRAPCSFSVLWIPARFPELNFSGKCCFFSFFSRAQADGSERVARGEEHGRRHRVGSIDQRSHPRRLVLVERQGRAFRPLSKKKKKFVRRAGPTASNEAEATRADFDPGRWVRYAGW